jgi:hypothetical protein
MKMIVVSSNDTNILEIDKSLFEKTKEFLTYLSKKEQKSFSYIDELGDTIVVDNGIAYVVPTKDDVVTMCKIKSDDFIDEDEAKRLLDV